MAQSQVRGAAKAPNKVKHSLLSRLSAVGGLDGAWSVPLQHDMMYYTSAGRSEGQASGAYIFRPANVTPVSWAK
jgi:hypothetical protein